MKKVLLLLWKVLLTSLGGMDVLKDLKAKYRKESGLAEVRSFFEIIFSVTRFLAKKGC